MHQEIKAKLPDAKGVGELVIVTFIDVREFSSFAEISESAEAALFLRNMYQKILEDYFPEATYFKLTGDGLMLIQSYDKNTLEKIVNSTLETSIKLVNDFPNISQDDPMINFDVPGKIGIGISRGATTCLVSDDVILDYSGRPLNLAARLMDLARPLGVVFDAKGLGITIVREDLREQFSSEQVYIRGISETVPTEIRYLTGKVEIEPQRKLPINQFKMKYSTHDTCTLSRAIQRGNQFNFNIDEEPANLDSCSVVVSFSESVEGVPTGLMLHETHKAKYSTLSGRHMISYDAKKIGEVLKALGYEDSTELKFVTEFLASPSNP